MIVEVSMPQGFGFTASRDVTLKKIMERITPVVMKQVCISIQDEPSLHEDLADTGLPAERVQWKVYPPKYRHESMFEVPACMFYAFCGNRLGFLYIYENGKPYYNVHYVCNGKFGPTLWHCTGEQADDLETAMRECVRVMLDAEPHDCEWKHTLSDGDKDRIIREAGAKGI